MTDQIAVTGNITSIPERRNVADGTVMVTFGLATTERRNENGQWADAHTNFYNVAVFRKLAEHAHSSLVKGQRVIIAGKVKVKQWEVNGRKGTSVDLEATSLGPDLMFGVATFVKDGATHDTYRAPQDGVAEADRSGEQWATVEPGADTRADTDSDEGAPAETAHRAEGQLVGAGAWSAPGEDPTPF